MPLEIKKLTAKVDFDENMANDFIDRYLKSSDEFSKRKRQRDPSNMAEDSAPQI